MPKQVILGVSCFAHDTSACLVDYRSGAVLFAIAEERLTNVKHESRFPIGAIRRALACAEDAGFSVVAAGIGSAADVMVAERVGFYLDQLDPGLTADIVSLLQSLLPYLDYYHISRRGFAADCINKFIADNVPPEQQEHTKRICAFGYNWAVSLRRAKEYLQKIIPQCPIFEVPHHLSHATSALFGSGFDQAALLVVDGQGETDTVSIFSYKGDGILRKHSSTAYPHSLGVLYLYATYHLGFAFGDEYKVMGMAAYGQPLYADELSSAMQVSPDGRLTFLPNDIFEFPQGPFGNAHVAMQFTSRLCELVPHRATDAEITQAHFDFAASVQMAVERAGVALARAAIDMVGERRLAMTGGVALNGLMNERIRQASGCDEIFIYPASGDDGTAIGAAQWVAMTNGARPARQIKTSFYGGSVNQAGIDTALSAYGLNYVKPPRMAAAIAEILAAGKIVARFVGRSEFGPRALGNRSILADPRIGEMRDILNRRIKHRENFRPFAPACLLEKASSYFEIDCSPFMLLICRVKENVDRIIPAVSHRDGTARVQTVASDTNPQLYETLEAFEKLTEVPILINTSFNVNGEAIVETIVDAIESFLYMDIDYLAAGDALVSKQDNLALSLSHLPSKTYLDRRRKRFADEFDEQLRHLDMSVFYDGLT